ncbi:MAG: Swt1 family HEPN domain-containing protein [Planctomyces sp.]|jgi:hypothetical protein
MKDPVSKGLDLLAKGLKPFVHDQILAAGEAIPDSLSAEKVDSLQLLVFIWERWNDIFRRRLTFVERSLVSELREFRNRWAHQQPFSEHDVYRFLEDGERLLKAIHSPDAPALTELRRNSLKRLYELEIAAPQPADRRHALWSFGLCLLCAVAVDFALLSYFRNPITYVMAVLFLILMVRLGYLLNLRESIPNAGPRECSDCGRIVYTAVCPYCETATLRHLVASIAHPGSSRESAQLPDSGNPGFVPLEDLRS